MRALIKFVVVAIVAFSSTATAAVDHRCRTMEHKADALARHRPESAMALPLPGPSGKGVRNSFPTQTYELATSANFALRWQDATVTDEEAQVVLGFLEEAWQKYMNEFGHTEPARWQSWKINAYLSRPQDTPSIDGGGYATIDDESFEYFVLDRRTLAEGDDTVAGFIAHEFYHDVQFTMDAYYTADWYWEATAEWAAMQLLPEGEEAFVYSGPFFLHTDLPLYYFGDFEEDFETGVHQYGAGYFIKYVSDTLGSVEPVVQSWEQGTSSGEPLGTLFAQTTEATLPAVFTEFAAKSAYLDFPEADRARILASVESFSTNAARIQATVPAAGIATTQTTDPLHSYGFHLIDVMRPTTGRAELTLTLGNATATPSASLGAAMILKDTTGVTYTPLAISGLSGTVALEIPNTVLSARVAVWVTSTDLRGVRPMTLSYAMTPLEAEEPDPDGDDGMTDGGDAGDGGGGDGDDEGGCCSTGGGGQGVAGSVGLALVAGLVMRRRRRA